MPEAVAVQLPAEAAAGALSALGEIYPMPGWDGAGLLAGAVTPARYLEGDGDAVRTRPLVALSRPAYPPGARLGSIRLDGGTPGFAWHRLYLEAALPPGTGITVGLGATDQPDADERRVRAASFRRRPAARRPGRGLAAAGLGAALSPGPARRGAEPRPLRPVLLPRPGARRARTAPCAAAGSTWRSALHGDGRATPELASLRIWGPRFSYRDRYLPRLYRSPIAAAGDSDDERRARLDFLDRYLALFEGVLTPIEDEIASAFRLFAPATAPADFARLARVLARPGGARGSARRAPPPAAARGGRAAPAGAARWPACGAPWTP